jgi:hypothetical protein
MATNIEHCAGSYDPHPWGYAEPANANLGCSAGTYDPAPISPILELRPTGSGVALARALVRVLVRRALIQEGVVRTAEDCAKQAKTG